MAGPGRRADHCHPYRNLPSTGGEAGEEAHEEENHDQGAEPCGQEKIQFGLTLSMLHMFLLRGPSEWWDQAKPERLQFAQGYLRYGPIRRKHRKTEVTLYRPCVCKTNRILCVHLWWQAWEQERPRFEEYLNSSPDRWTKKLRGYLREIYPGMPETELQSWTTHACRRGAAADILHSQGLGDKGGLKEMLLEADWASPQGAHPYTPADEIEEVSMGEVLIDQLD